MDRIQIKQEVIPHLWPESIEEFLIFNFTKYGFINLYEICDKKYDEDF